MKARIATTPRTVLVWNLPEGSASRKSVDEAAAAVSMTVHPVGPEDLGQSIASLCGLPGPCMMKPQAGKPEQDFPAAAIFCGLDDWKLDIVLADLRKQGAMIPLKATVTPTNQHWTLGKLLEELCEERAALAGAPV